MAAAHAGLHGASGDQNLGNEKLTGLESAAHVVHSGSQGIENFLRRGVGIQCFLRQTLRVLTLSSLDGDG